MADLRELVERVMVEECAAENALANGNAEAWAYCCSRVQSEKLVLCDALLTSRAVEAVEVLRQVDAIVGRCSCRDGIQCDVCGETERKATDMVLAVRRALKLADALAGEVDQ